MALCKPSVRAEIVLLLLLVAIEMGGNKVEATQARTCKYLSQKFKGACLSRRKCASICQGEGFPNGHCSAFRRRCLCTKPC